MKQKLILVCMLLLSSVAIAQGRFDATIWGGLDMSQIDGDGAGHYQHLGFHAAINTTFALGKDEDSHWKMLIELGYSQRGSHIDKVNMKINLQYVEIPIMMTYRFGQFRIGAGIAPGLLVNATVIESNVPNDIAANAYYKFDKLPVLAELNWCRKHWMVLARIQTSMLPISSNIPYKDSYRIFRSNKGEFSRSITIGVGYKF